jgi:hypothetical protein
VNAATPPSAARWPGRRRRLLWLAAALLLPLLGFFALRWALQPERLGALLLDRAARATGLELAVSEPARLGIWPGLQLELVGLTARSDAASAPLLRAERVDVALPLSILRRAESLQVGSLRLIGPSLDLAAWQDWQARQAGDAQPLQLPDVALQVDVERGVLVGDGWSLVDLDLGATPLRDGEPFRLALRATLHPAAGDSPLDPLPIALQLQTIPEQADDGVLLSDATLRLGSAERPELLTLAGRIDLLLPQTLRLALAGELADSWPGDWPALPETAAPHLLGEPLELAYDGPGDGSGQLSLRSQGSRRQLALQAEPQALLDWLGQDPRPPLPPLDGSLQAAELQFDQLRLHGVTIRLEQEPAAEPQHD